MLIFTAEKNNRDLKSGSLIVELVDKFHDDLAAVALWNGVGMGYTMAATTRRHLSSLEIQKCML